MNKPTLDWLQARAGGGNRVLRQLYSSVDGGSVGASISRRPARRIKRIMGIRNVRFKTDPLGTDHQVAVGDWVGTATMFSNVNPRPIRCWTTRPVTVNRSAKQARMLVLRGQDRGAG